MDLTSDQKRVLLFNVNRPFEVPIQEFDNEWWPLVSNIWTRFNYKNLINGDSWKTFACRFTKHNQSSTRKEGVPLEKRRKTKIRPANLCFAKIKVSWFISRQKVRVERYNNCPDHTHTLEESERLKRSNAIRVLVEEEASKNYPPPAIVSAVKEYATEKLDLGASVKELRRREVTNIKYKVRGPQNVYLIGNTEIESDIEEAISFLVTKGYQVERYETSQSTHGLAFVHPYQLEKLQRYGWLTLIDSTHKTNKHNWNLFTLYIRDGFGCWDVGAHFFVSNEDSVTVTEALMIIRRFGPNWKPRYFLTDQSNIEINSIKTAFPGLLKGEQECNIIFCTVHIMRTWMRKIYNAKTREKMIQAMHKITKIGCEEVIQQTINDCPVPAIRSYILRNFKKNTHQWALWARQHSPFLLQVTSTNSLESYHSELKRTTSFQYGLIGACHKIIDLDTKKHSDAEHTAFEFRLKKISAIGVDQEILEEIHQFPFPIQQLIINEFCAVERRIEKGKNVPGLMSLHCYCLFFRQYLLPCRHIFHEHTYGPKKLLTSNAWVRFQQMFEESGFEVYEHRELTDIELSERIGTEKTAENRRLVVNELMERTRNMYWTIEEGKNLEKKSEFIEKLKTCLEPILNTQIHK